MAGPVALLFDVFGTVVDWRTTVARECRDLADRTGNGHVEAEAFADRWRALYRPSMDAVRRGDRPWTPLDRLHRESLDVVVAEFGMQRVTLEELDGLNLAWHRLHPWPDVRQGMERLHRRYPLVTCSNGNVALQIDLIRGAQLSFDAILGPPVARAYKPDPAAYLTTADLLGLEPADCMLVAAHNDDLSAARALGFATAFVARPVEHGPDQRTDLGPDADWDVVARDFVDLAARLGA